ncbi:MAG TPA: hypothetical protein VER76_14450 [Pyrinomonadaceae bacterium]|nr:hypothetical protein [Pyrinomonadaceae bacterium]
MIALFIIAFVLLAATAYTFYRRLRTSPDYRAELQSPPASPRSLFDHREADAEHTRLLAAQAVERAAEKNASLLARASAGDLTALAEAHRAKDAALYESVLRGLLEWAEGAETNLHALAAFVANDTDLRGSPALAEAYLKFWQHTRDRLSLAEMLHLAALSDDAATFERAAEAACEALRANRLEGVSPGELATLIESEYWVLSSEARRAGAGFVLKEKLATLGDELARVKKTETRM